MRYRKGILWLFTLLLTAVAAILWTQEPSVEQVPLAITLSAAGKEEYITCWENEAGEYYLFLPSYADCASARLQIHGRDVTVDGKPAENGMSCEGFLLDTPYSFTFDSVEGTVDTVLTFVRSADMPTLYIDTGSGSMEYIHGKKGNQEAGRMSLYTPEGELAYIGNLDAVQGRGNDWLIGKKSYSLQLASGSQLLGMAQAENWILQANAFDGSHLRNKLVYDFAAAAGLAYSPESRWVDLYLNGEYAGLYLLCERNELHENRISLDGQGQYLVSMDVQWRLEENVRPFVTTQSGYAFRIHSSQINETSLQQLLQSVENAICADDGCDPLTGTHWSEWIDADSWVRKYLVEEIFGNGDAGAISQYFYGTAGETRMYAGPVWDYDISMGNSLSQDVTYPSSLFADRARVRSTISVSWFYELYRQEDFYRQVTAVYRDVFLPLLDTFFQEKLEEYTAQIEAASAMNQLRWENLAACQLTAAEETENIRSFMTERIAFLNQLWVEEEAFCRVLVDPNDGHGTMCFAVRPGEQIPFLPEYTQTPEILGWYAAGSEEPFDLTQPIWEDTQIILRRSELQSVSQEQEESGRQDRSIALKDIPFGMLLMLLGLLGWLDSRRPGRRADRKQGKTAEECTVRRDG